MMLPRRMLHSDTEYVGEGCIWNNGKAMEKYYFLSAYTQLNACFLCQAGIIAAEGCITK